MCSASMGAEGSVTLQLREAVQAPEAGNSINSALAIGYPDPDILVDVLGTLQSAALSNNNNNTIITKNSAITNSSIINGGRSNTVYSSNSNISRSITSNGCSPTVNASQITHLKSKPTNGNVISNGFIENAVNISNPSSSTKKHRAKALSPTRHGPQQCPICNKIFGNASALAKHKLTHSDERKYVCVMCSKAFKRQDHLNGHMMTHRNKKPYECRADGCGKSYCDARSLRRHTENHHTVLAMTPTTPNQSIPPSTGPLTGLSLSPSTASGEVSSPHGAACDQYSNNSDVSNPTSLSLSIESGNDGLTRHQLDLIGQIINETEQANAQITFASNVDSIKKHEDQRNRNIQTQRQQTQLKDLPVTTEAVTSTINIPKPTDTNNTKHDQKDQEISQISKQNNHHSHGHGQQQRNGHIINIIGVEQKPVECNLCHRKFKNMPALNGHMRLHGGFFKKDNDSKKSDNKESTGPPLQTASVGVRALIEEKIISKRGRDLKGAFVISTLPLTTSTTTTTNTHKIDTDNSLTNFIGKSRSTSGILRNISQTTKTVATSIQSQKQSNNKTTGSSVIATQTATTISKDATLIELLKRGTKVAVARATPDSSGQIFGTNSSTSSVILPSAQTLSLNSGSNECSPLALSLSPDATPLALTISQAPNGSGDVLTLTYSSDSSTTFFADNDVYRVSADTTVLLQSVDSIELLENGNAKLRDNHNKYSLTNGTLSSDAATIIETVGLTKDYNSTSNRLESVLESTLADNLSGFASIDPKDCVLYNCNNDTPLVTNNSDSTLATQLMYSIPDNSHTIDSQDSSFLNEIHNITNPADYFDNKIENGNIINHRKTSDLMKSYNESEFDKNDKIIKFKNDILNQGKGVIEVIEKFFKNKDTSTDNDYDIELKEVEKSLFSLNRKNCHDHLDLKDFGNQNEAFLIEAKDFYETNRNVPSPLTSSYFNEDISTNSKDTKTILKEFPLNKGLQNDSNFYNDINLYDLPEETFQFQMLSDSDDPFISSSTKKFDHNFGSPIDSIHLKKSHSFEDSLNIGQCNSPLKDDADQFLHSAINNIANSVNITEASSKKNNCYNNYTPNNIFRKRLHMHTPKKSQYYRSKLRKPSTSHYTPSPILNPDRNSPGLYSMLPNSLIDDDFDLVDDFYNNTTLITFLDDSKVNIGTNYQATIPPLNAPNTSAYKSKDNYEEPMWNPNLMKDENLLIRYIELSKSSAVPLGFHSEEAALKTLLDSQGETHVAILNLLQTPSTKCHLKWTSNEIEIFLNGLEVHGKNFYQISKQITTKSTGECIQLYYFWKKICTNYKIAHLRQDASEFEESISNQALHSHSEIRPHVCDMPDCSASFTSKAALHGHARIHCFGKNLSHSSSNSHAVGISSTPNGTSIKDDYPCKACGKVFNKVKSRSAHMKSHRPQENETN